MNGVAERRAPFYRPENAGDRLKRATSSNLRVAPLVDVRPDALHRRDAGLAARGFEAVEARAIDRLERKLVLKTGLGAGIELARRRDRTLAIQVRAVALEAQRPGSPTCVPVRPNDIGSSGTASRFPLQSIPAARTQHLRTSAFQLSTWKANPLILYELTVFLCHGSQSTRWL
ncbi:MAG TPA: hypothetical protein VK504_23280 [Vicinamibacterales bacterium]|nr:hypothetical protein [Vicinamibacterales bacterium]